MKELNAVAKMIEYATYQLKRGVRDEAFLDAVKIAMGELATRHSPIHWDLFRTGEGAFVDLIRSDDPSRTEQDFKALLQVPQIQKMYAMIDMTTLKHSLLDLKLSYPG
jgi:hypothetical protein